MIRAKQNKQAKNDNKISIHCYLVEILFLKTVEVCFLSK